MTGCTYGQRSWLVVASGQRRCYLLLHGEWRGSRSGSSRTRELQSGRFTATQRPAHAVRLDAYTTPLLDSGYNRLVLLRGMDTAEMEQVAL